MRRWAALGPGAVSAGLGVLMHLPTYNALFIPQLLLNEVGWLPAAIGGAAVWLGRKRQSKLAMALGVAGAALSLYPYRNIRQDRQRNADALRAGLGDDYEQAIPPALRDSDRQPQPVTVTRDVVYAQPGNRALKLDVYQPELPPLVGERYPAVIVIHGGSWRMGDKGNVFKPHTRHLARQRYVVFDIQYRLSHEAKWPAQLNDVRAAIAWVKAQAAEYRIDPARIALVGRSAGAHLALSAAYRCNETNEDTSVASVVAIYPPTDLRFWPPDPNNSLAKLIGGTPVEMPEAYADASPIEFCRDDLPPTLLVQGEMDNLVTPEHVQALSAKLAATNTRVVLLWVPWGRHGFDVLSEGMGARLVRPPMDRFLAWSLYRPIPSPPTPLPVVGEGRKQSDKFH